MRVFPRRLPGARIILPVLDVLAALEHQDAQTALGEFLGRPASGDSGADDDGIEGLGLLLSHDALIMSQFLEVRHLVFILKGMFAMQLDSACSRWAGHQRWAGDGSATTAGTDEAKRETRQALLDELRPVTLANCSFKRFGSKNDGGYIMCENLVGVEAGYSYGIGGNDDWGCEISKTFGVPMHQYRLFSPPALTCAGGRVRAPQRVRGAQDRDRRRSFL